MKKVLLLIFILFTIGVIHGQNESIEEGAILEDKIQNPIAIWYYLNSMWLRVHFIMYVF